MNKQFIIFVLRHFVFTCFLMLLLLQGTQAWSQCSEPAPNSACTPPATFNKTVTIAAGQTLDWTDNTSTNPQNLPDPNNGVTIKIKIVGAGPTSKIRIAKGSSQLNLLIKQGGVVYVDNATLEVNGDVQIVDNNSKFLMCGGTLRTTGNFQQQSSGDPVCCITGSIVEIGDENAGGLFNVMGQTYTSANFQNDGGYRYLKNVCLNVTHDYQLQSTGSGSGLDGLDILINVCAHIGDQGATQAPTLIKDGQDSGNLQFSNKTYIQNSRFWLPNGNTQFSNGKQKTLCDVGFFMTDGSFQNSSSSPINGSTVCIGLLDGSDVVENFGTWALSGTTNYSDPSGTAIGMPGSVKRSQSQIIDCMNMCTCSCNISDITTVPSACTGSTYSLSGTIVFQGAPCSGTLTISIPGGGTQVINAPFISPVNYTIGNLAGDGASYTVTASFSAGVYACSFSETYTAPNCAPCPFGSMTATPGSCLPATNQYTLTGVIAFTTVPSTGSVRVEVLGGGVQILNAPFSNPLNYSISGLLSDGSSHTVYATYGKKSCLQMDYMAPAICGGNKVGRVSERSDFTQPVLISNSNMSGVIQELTILPNPFDDRVSIQFSLVEPTDVQLTVHDLSGRLVHTATLGNRADGEQMEEIETASWQAGFYMLTLRDAAGGRTVRKLVKM